MGRCLSSDLGGVYVGKGGVSVVPPEMVNAVTFRVRAVLVARRCRNVVTCHVRESQDRNVEPANDQNFAPLLLT